MADIESRMQSRNPDAGLEARIQQETRRILGQHDQLNTFFLLVIEGVQTGSLQATRLAFTRFRDALEAHIAVEDSSWFPALRGLRPHLAPRLAQLVLDHSRFRERLEELFDELAKGSAESFGDGFAGFCDEFADHEEREEALAAAAAAPEA